MKVAGFLRRKRIELAAALALPALVGATGCQVDVAGQTLPSPYWLSDDVQYFAPGPEFKLAKEAATMEREAGEAAAFGGPAAVPVPGAIAPGLDPGVVPIGPGGAGGPAVPIVPGAAP